MPTIPDYDLYETLDVSPDANTAEIDAAWTRLVKLVHPDAGGSAALFARVNLARQILSDPGRRAAYDRSRTAPGGPTSPSQPVDVHAAQTPNPVQTRTGWLRQWADANPGRVGIAVNFGVAAFICVAAWHHFGPSIHMWLLRQRDMRSASTGGVLTTAVTVLLGEFGCAGVLALLARRRFRRGLGQSYVPVWLPVFLVTNLLVAGQVAFGTSFPALAALLGAVAMGRALFGKDARDAVIAALLTHGQKTAGPTGRRSCRAVRKARGSLIHTGE